VHRPECPARPAAKMLPWYVDPVVPASYHDFFGSCATVAGALIGLLFVAISIFPQRLTGDETSTEYQTKAGAAFSALTNTLIFSLIALLPGASFGTAVIALAATGLATTGSLIILLYREHKRFRLGRMVLPFVLLILYGLQLANGIGLNQAPDDAGRVANQGVLAIGLFVFAISRAWQLVGAWDLSLLTTVAKMSRTAFTGEGDQVDEAGLPDKATDPGQSSD
jgi:hypothetical protein